MKSASRLFYLSIFALWATPGDCAGFSNECAISPKSIVEDACVSYATLDRLNAQVKPALVDLTRETDFFSYYRLNLFNKKCPFWDDENGMCGNIACAVETLDNEEDVPEIWRAKELSKLEGPLAKHPDKKAQRKHPQRPLQGKLGDDVGESCVVEYDDECDERDYCVPEDESASSKGDYVSLLQNPERFTGYGGESSWQIWDAIYGENCFQKSSFPSSADLGSSQWPAGPAQQDFKHILDAAGRQAQLEQPRQHKLSTPFVANTQDECLEKRVFYRVVSGMHASISAHLCWDFLNQTTGEWQPNLACYVSRLHEHPDRISNLYFNFALVTRAVAKLGPYLKDPKYTFCTGDPVEDSATRAKVQDVTDRAASVPHIFDESLMFVNGEGPSLKEDFRNRFRNVSRLMDCVGCDKCRLWGKVQTNGYGTALKVLFEFDSNSQGVEGYDDVPTLKRTELVALFNTYARLSQSMAAIKGFHQMLADGHSAHVYDEPEKAREVEEVLEGQALEEEDIKEETREEEDDEEDDIEFIAETEQDKAKSEMEQFLARQRQGASQPRTVRESFERELSLFVQAFRIVLSRWLRLPKVLWHIVSTEAVRLFQFWIGLPVNPRAWKFELPQMQYDEL